MVFALLVAGATGRGDGKVLAPVLLPQEVAMPDQRALLAWRDGVQTLVIESTFVGEGTDFAWVVPLPSKPEVEAATRGSLPAVAALMQPEVLPAGQDLWWVLIAVGTVALWAVFFGWRTIGLLMRAGVVGGLGASVGMVAAAILGFGWICVPAAIVLALWLGRGVVRERWSLFHHLVVGIVGFLLAALLLPTVGKVRSTLPGETVAAGLHVERRVVGDFDVALLSGPESGAVVPWLEENGFSLSGPAKREAERHAAAGGWFVASRVRRDFAERGRGVAAPLAFRFASERPVYPMRFTGAGATEALELELFVFGPERASSDRLSAPAWAPLRFEEPAGTGFPRRAGQPRDARVVSHPQLRRLAEGTAVVTRLRGRLAPAAMQTDLELGWIEDGPRSRGLVAYAREAAVQLGVAAGLAVLLCGAVFLGFRHAGQRPPRRPAFSFIAAGAALGAGLAWTLPSVPVRDEKGAPRWHDLRQVEQLGLITLGERDPRGSDEAQVRKVFADELARFAAGQGWQLKVGDGPGEADLERLPDGRWRVVIYDAAGQPRFQTGNTIALGELRR